MLCALEHSPFQNVEHAFRCPWRVSLSIHGSYEKSIDIILYIALFGSHALRKKIIHCVLCFGAFTILERGAYILSSAIRLSCFGTPKSTVYIFRRYRALTLWERRIFVEFFALGHSRFQSEEHAFIVLSVFVSPAIHWSYEFGRIAYHQYVNIYAVHQLYDSWYIVSRPIRPVRVVRVVPSRLKCSVTNDTLITIDPRPVQPVNQCFTTCMGRTSRV